MVALLFLIAVAAIAPLSVLKAAAEEARSAIRQAVPNRPLTVGSVRRETVPADRADTSRIRLDA
jgi:hypothetical protein